MELSSWLSLTEYSTKYRVSVSTLRRRIKSNDVVFQFENGKYFLKDEAQPLHRWHRPSQEIGGEVVVSEHRPSLEMNKEEVTDVLETTRKMITEVKEAYDLLLKDKETKILSLKNEMADLKTLVSVLESENKKLKAKFSQKIEKSTESQKIETESLTTPTYHLPDYTL